MVSTRIGALNVSPPSFDVTTRYWSSSWVSPFRKPTQSWPVTGLTVGSLPWSSSQLFPPANEPEQNLAAPLITFGSDHERAWSSEWLSKIWLATVKTRVPICTDLKIVYVTYRRSGPTTAGPQGRGVPASGVSHPGTPPPRRPAAPNPPLPVPG